MKKNHSVTGAGVLVSLTGDGTYEYNDRFYAVEVTLLDIVGEKDSVESGLKVTASALEVKTFLDAAAAQAQAMAGLYTVAELAAGYASHENFSGKAAMAGLRAVAALQEGNPRRSAVLTLPQ